MKSSPGCWRRTSSPPSPATSPPFKGRLRNLGDPYFAILWPDGIRKPDEAVIWTKTTRPTTYRQNKGLDVNKDGVITRAEIVDKVTALLAEGMRPANALAA